MKKLTLLLLSLGLLAPTVSTYAMDDFPADNEEDMMGMLGGMDPSQLAELMEELRASLPDDLQDEFEAMQKHQEEQAAKYQAIADEQKALEDELLETKNDKRELKEAMAVLLKDKDGRDLDEIAAEQKDLEERLAELKKERKAKKQEMKLLDKRREDLDKESEQEMEKRSKAFEEKAQAFEDGDEDAYEDGDEEMTDADDAEEVNADDVPADDRGDDEDMGDAEEDFSMPPVPNLDDEELIADGE